MNGRITEEDLLALIEGELPAHRVPEVRAALDTDKALRARVERMILDRNRLRDLASQQTVRAPEGILEDAMGVAARSALFDEDEERTQARRRRRRHMVIAAGVGLAFVGSWVGSMWWFVGPGSAERHQRVAKHPQDRIISGELKIAPGSEIKDPEVSEESPEFADAPAPGGSIDALAESWERMEGVSSPPESDLLEEFLAASGNVSQGFNASDHSAQLQGADDIAARGDELTPLLLDGRIRLVVNGEARSPAYASETPIPSPPSPPPSRLSIEVDASDPVSVSDDFGRVIKELEARTGQSVLVQIVPENEADRSLVRPRMHFGDVFWWFGEPQQWGSSRVIDLPILYESEQGQASPTETG